MDVALVPLAVGIGDVRTIRYGERLNGCSEGDQEQSGEIFQMTEPVIIPVANCLCEHSISTSRSEMGCNRY